MNCHIPKLSKFATRWPTIIHSLSSSAAMHHQVPANSNIGKHIVSSLVSPNVAFPFVIPHLFLIKESSFPILLMDIYHFNNALYVCPRIFIIVLLTQLFSNKMLTNKIFSWLFSKSDYFYSASFSTWCYHSTMASYPVTSAIWNLIWAFCLFKLFITHYPSTPPACLVSFQQFPVTVPFSILLPWAVYLTRSACPTLCSSLQSSNTSHVIHFTIIFIELLEKISLSL